MMITFASFARQKKVQKSPFSEIKIQKATDFSMHKEPPRTCTTDDLF